MKRVCAALVLAIVLLPTIGYAQQVVPTAPFVLNLDYAKFRHSDSSGYLEIYYGFYPRLICYDVREGRYVGALKVNTRIKDRRTGQYLVNKRSVVPLVLTDTTERSIRSLFISISGYALPFGDYVAEVVAVDSLVSSRRDSVALPLVMQPYSSNVASSDLELCSNITNSEVKDNAFYKNSLDVMPNPTLIFGIASHPVMFHYAEIYNLDREKMYAIKTQIIAQDGKVVKESSKSRKYGVNNAVEAGTTNVASLPSGKYRLRLTIADSSGPSFTQSEKVFFIYNPHVKVPEGSSITLKANELAGMSAQELAEEFLKAQYVATDGDIKTFSQITSADGRREFLAKFWSEVEGGRLGRPPIQRFVYLQRVLVAEQRYRSMGRTGWRTDRGRVYILYAEPDEIERFPSSESSKPYEIWHYYSIENGVEFDFVDRSGFGEYVLVNSTKRGELQDTDWQRFLQ